MHLPWHSSPLAAHHLDDVRGEAIDGRAMADLRAKARLRLALLHAKRTIAAYSLGPEQHGDVRG